jgi:hypothetical protein
LDYGVALQLPGGGFGALGGFHSNSLFIEGLSRACLLDPSGINARRRNAILMGYRWLIRPENSKRGFVENFPYTHRDYILAAALGQAAAVLNIGADRFAAEWALRGTRKQLPSGVNPEAGGSDVSYQMAGVLFAMRYFVVAPSDVRRSLTLMVNNAIAWELYRVNPSGEIPIGSSTRVGHEYLGGTLKSVNYREAIEALSYSGHLLSNARWLDVAEIVKNKAIERRNV